SISRYAFYTATDLNGVTIPDSVTSISDHAFYECINLRSVTLPKGIESIEDHLFYNCRKLSEIVIPDGVGVIKEYAFSKCESLTSAMIPNSVTKIGDHAFYECKNLKNTVIPNGVVTIDEYAFCGCLSLTSAEISDSVAEIGAFSFSFNPNLKGVKLSKGLKCISYGAFHRCTGLEGIEIPESVDTIDYVAFSGCTGLSSVKLPASVKTIGFGAFVECENLTDVYYNGSKKQWDAVSIDDYNPSLLSAKIHFDGAVKVNPEFICQKGTNAVKLSWDEVEGAEMYGIAGFVDGKWKLLDKTTDTSYIINNLKAGQNYKVAVVAMFGGEWCMDLSKAQTVTPKQEATALYPKVYVQVKDGKIGIKWDKVTGAEKYGIGVYQNNKWKVVKQLDGSITRWTSPQVRSGKYKMVVLAKVNGQWVTADVFKKSVYVTVN
ncbi:leucine-rich repeat domain-containing protein, partial [uncultured Ruminococcus sp.]|uniref:leucine-rich repeat domain-containing protein n=1 Tax=uncultured Ruminococcus sp. TaxID=165186 RepID=UPI0025F7613C